MNPDYFKSKKNVLYLLSFVVGLAAASGPGTQLINEVLSNEVRDLGVVKETREAQIRQWKQDAEDARRLAKTIAEKDVTAILTPTNRRESAVRLESLANQAGLTNFRFSLSPSLPWTGEEGASAIHGIVQSQLKIEADAPHDIAVLRFLESLTELPGRMDTQELALFLIARKNDKIPNLTNVHMRAQLLWIANEEKGTTP